MPRSCHDMSVCFATNCRMVPEISKQHLPEVHTTLLLYVLHIRVLQQVFVYKWTHVLPVLLLPLTPSPAAAQLSLGFKDPRVNLRITDGIKWVTDAEEGTYDAIIVDSSDPVGPAEVLFEEVQEPQMRSGAGHQRLHGMLFACSFDACYRSDRCACPIAEASLAQHMLTTPVC